MNERLPAHRRRRLAGFDYTSNGAYFITICAYQRAPLFVDKGIQKTIIDCWMNIPAHFPHITLDSFVIMPNHVHGIVNINETPAAAVRQFHEIAVQQRKRGTQPGSLSGVVQSFKAAVTRELRMQGLVALDQRVWHSNYYDRVIRSEAELDRVRLYIANNPSQWAFDHENPAAEHDAPYVAAWGWLEGAAS
ncbi:MAG: transposase [Dehalococcoidia bacterium]